MRVSDQQGRLRLGWCRLVLLGVAFCLTASVAEAQGNDGGAMRDTIAVRMLAGRQVPPVDIDTHGRLVAASAALVTQDGGIYIADNRSHRLLYFDAKGALVATSSLRASTEHPRLDISALGLDNSRRLYAYDGWSKRMYVVGRQGETLEWLKDFSVPIPATKMCVQRHHVFVLGEKDGNRVHEFGVDGGEKNSFAPVGNGGAEIATVALIGNGRMACSPAAGVVAITDGIRPSVEAYNLAGQRLWTYNVPKFHGLTVGSLPGGEVKYERANGPVDMIENLLAITPNVFAVQIARGDRGTGKSRQAWRIQTVFLSAESGRPLGRSDSIPSLTDAHDGIGWSLVNSGTPHVQLYHAAVAQEKHTHSQVP